MTIANCVEFFFWYIFCLRVTGNVSARERWMGSDHAHPEGIPIQPRAKDDTYCMTAIYYQDPFLDSFDSHVDTQTMLENAKCPNQRDKWPLDTQPRVQTIRDSC